MATDDTTGTADAPARGAQTVAPVQASALQFAASILGESSYTPEAQLGGTLSVPGRAGAQPDPRPAQPVTQPVIEPVAPPVARPVAEPVAQPVAEPVAEPVAQRKGWFGRLLDALLRRG
ncbi:hypothetical protein [Kineococcus gypseus]|uniref:hypothetical protein n=1 Tax=Kineococcus gypseus TaxID=1637102 RepID=UPI003D7DA17F